MKNPNFVFSFVFHTISTYNTFYNNGLHITS